MLNMNYFKKLTFVFEERIVVVIPEDSVVKIMVKVLIIYKL